MAFRWEVSIRALLLARVDIVKKQYRGAAEVAPQLRVPTALAQDLRLVPGTEVRSLTAASVYPAPNPANSNGDLIHPPRFHPQ